MSKFFYRVQPLDTVSSLSKRFNIPPIKIIKDNNLSTEISGGDLLVIDKIDCRTYTVQPFDTPLSLSEKFSVSADEILTENGVDYLFYGLIIKI